MRQLLGIRWYDRVQNDEVLQRTGLTSLFRLLSRRRISVFGDLWMLSTVDMVVQRRDGPRRLYATTMMMMINVLCITYASRTKWSN